MNQIGIPESERPELLAYLKKTYRYEDGRIFNRRTGRRRRGGKTSSGYLGFNFNFKGKGCRSYIHRIVWALCYDQLPTQTIDHINGDKLDNHIKNLREVSQSSNNLNTLLPWRPNKDSGVPGVFPHLGKFETRIQGHLYSFCNPYEAFYWAIACGKRYRGLPQEPTPSPSRLGGEF
jgi:hypothetical protein